MKTVPRVPHERPRPSASTDRQRMKYKRAPERAPVFVYDVLCRRRRLFFLLLVVYRSGPAPDDPARVGVEILRRPVDRAQRPRAGIRQLADADGKIGRALIEIFDERAERTRRLIDLAAFAVLTAGEVLQPLGDLVDAVGIARQSAGELVKIVQRAVERFLVFLDELLHLAQCVACGLRDVLGGAGRGREQRRVVFVALGADQW